MEVVVSAFPSGVFETYAEADAWARQQKALAFQMRMDVRDFGTERVVRVPVINAGSERGELVVPVSPAITLRERAERLMEDALKEFGWRRDVRFKSRYGYERCLWIMR